MSVIGSEIKITTDEQAIDLTTLTVEKVQQGFQEGTFTAESLTQACLRQIELYKTSTTTPSFS